MPKLYDASDERRGVRLRFVPDTEHAETAALLLMAFGYKALKGRDTVSIRDVHGGALRAYLEAPNSSLKGGADAARPWGIMQGADGAVRLQIEAGNLVRVGLGEGGAYRLTPEGEEAAKALAADLISRA